MRKEEKDEIIENALRLILKANMNGVSNYKIAKDTNITERTIGNYVNGTTKPTFSNAKILIDYFAAENRKSHMESLHNIIGEQTKIIESNNKEFASIYGDADIENFPKTNYRMIPLLNLDVVGGASNQEMDTAEYVEKYVPFLDAQNGDICCPVTNNSMSPVYTPGTLVQLRKIERWRDYVEYGQVYVVDLVDGRRLIKQVKKSEKKNTFVLHSYNNEYDDNDIPVNMIYSMWLVIAKYEKMVM